VNWVGGENRFVAKPEKRGKPGGFATKKTAEGEKSQHGNGLAHAKGAEKEATNHPKNKAKVRKKNEIEEDGKRSNGNGKCGKKKKEEKRDYRRRSGKGRQLTIPTGEKKVGGGGR